MRRDAESLLERAREVSLGNMTDTRQPPDGPVLVRGGVHPVLRTQQAAQQLGVLACGTFTQSRLRMRSGLPQAAYLTVEPLAPLPREALAHRSRSARFSE